jgi:hypothetical protein
MIQSRVWSFRGNNSSYGSENACVLWLARFKYIQDSESSLVSVRTETAFCHDLNLVVPASIIRR